MQYQPQAPIPPTVEIIVSRVINLNKLFFDGGNPYRHVVDQYFKPISEGEAYQIIISTMTKDEIIATSSNMIPEVYKRLQMLPQLRLDMEKCFNEQQNLLNLKNGICDIFTHGMVYGTNIEFRFDYQYDFSYMKGRTLDNAPNFKHYLETSVGKPNIKCFLRVLAYIISSLTEAKKAFFFIGDGNTGKSMMLDIIEMVMGEDVVSSEPFETLGNEQARANFQGKRLNISREAKRSILRNEAAFKSLVANEKITGRKLYKNGITFTPHIKFVVASNQPVEFKNPDDALYDRMVIIFFHSTLSPEQLDRDLKNKLWKERDVIFSLAMDTLPDLIDSGYDFKMSEESLNYLHACKNQLHTVEDFLAERCEISEHAEIPTSVLHEAYLKFCRRNDYEPVGRNTFYDQIKWYGGSGISRIKTHDKDGIRVQGFSGIKLKKVIEQDAKQEQGETSDSSDSSPQRLARPPP